MTGDLQATISIFSADDIASHVRELGALLHACVHDGASIGFVLPFAQGEARRSGATRCCRRCARRAGAAGSRGADGRIAGSVQLDYDTPPNQPHRAEVRKLLVHPDFRRRGIARR